MTRDEGHRYIYAFGGLTMTSEKTLHGGQEMNASVAARILFLGVRYRPAVRIWISVRAFKHIPEGV